MSNDKRNHNPGEFNLDFSLEDTAEQKMRVAPGSVRVGVKGYDPYDAPIKASKKTEPKRKPTDLRKLSEWIRMQRQVAELKKSPEDEDSSAEE